MTNLSIINSSPSTKPPIKYISTKTFEKLKQEARILKKKQHINHVKALEEVAKSHGFHHWKDVCNALQRMRPTEDSFYNGCVACIEVGTYPIRTNTQHYIEESFLLKHFCKKNLKNYYQNISHYYVGWGEIKEVDIDKENYMEIMTFYRIDNELLKDMKNDEDIMEFLTCTFNGLLFYWYKGIFTSHEEIIHYKDNIPVDFAF